MDRTGQPAWVRWFGAIHHPPSTTPETRRTTGPRRPSKTRQRSPRAAEERRRPVHPGGFPGPCAALRLFFGLIAPLFLLLAALAAGGAARAAEDDQPWLRPYSGPTRSDVDAKTLDGKVLC